MALAKAGRSLCCQEVSRGLRVVLVIAGRILILAEELLDGQHDTADPMLSVPR